MYPIFYFKLIRDFPLITVVDSLIFFKKTETL